jgi:GLPGLI family protein
MPIYFSLWALAALWGFHARQDPAPAFLIKYDCLFNEHFDRDRLDKHYLAELRLKGDSSYFYITPDDSWPPEPDGPNATSYHMDTLLRVVKNRGTQNLVFGEPFLKGRDRFFRDSLFPMHWELLPDERRVGEYVCKGAKAHFKGREYTCWYTTNIPIPDGPWKLGGLPGLIVEAYDDADDLHFTLSGIEPTSGIQLAAPDGMVGVLDDYENYRESWRNIARRIEASMASPDGSDCVSCQTRSKVKFYLWEKPLD